tara:strand:+ start:4238 stop:4630 length:393 start_codon:yes stop_codon:yes gene_type:complete
MANVEIIWTEKHFISRKYKYGGTPDLLVKENGKYILIDFKTSSAIYVDNLIQGSAYAHLIKENEKIEIDKFFVARFPKDDSPYEIREFDKTDLKKGFKLFRLLRDAFDEDKQLKKRVRKNAGTKRTKRKV